MAKVRTFAAVLSLITAIILLVPTALPAAAQEEAASAEADSADRVSRAIGAMQLRGIGPAVMGGRIADVEVHPEEPGTWYVGVGSGGVWKTTNAGVTWTPIFDDQHSYSIGDVALDPTNPEVVWVGTGENVSGRHVAWGNGVYRSLDGGGTWERMGLPESEHIGKIVVHPEDGDVVFVAAEGPLWSSGGQRGVYRTTDGGDSWEAVLEIDENTGATDLELDPSDPDTIYAAAYQRRRSVAAFLGGGPQSGIYKSTDGGDSWRRIEPGLPRGDMGKIGLAVTPADPDLVYATIEADETERGLYRSTDKGESWERRSSYISGGTGPHYYQEIEVSPVDPDVIYQMDVFVHVSRDGGASFEPLSSGREKHSDNHAFWIDPDNPLHLIAGTDAGLYESFDDGVTWRHFPNLPISQFYKVAVDSSEPFYNVLGGAQDLGTLFGPSRTTNVEGIRNRDWYVPMGADGYNVAFDPEDPDVMYLETQVGNLSRVDRRSEEAIDIQPQPSPGEPPERFNWDAPLLVSPHDPHRLYFGSQRLWRSDDRGDSWTPVSEDLTRNLNRYALPIMDRTWSVDALFDHGAMSIYSTLTTLSESPLAEGVLYTGSDDGLVYVSEDGGDSWRQATALPGVPERSFINDVVASEHDPDAVFVLVDAHKIGDYTPYAFVSRDRGRSWTSIAGDLEDGNILWAIQQDHVDPDLLFVGAERGIYATVDGGDSWHRVGGAPTIAFRDLVIHRRDEDLVGATFGRGFYVLDDYAPLRELGTGALEQEAALFPVRDAWWYVPNVPMQARGMPTLGTDSFVADNPPFGAVFTYHLAAVPQTAEEIRRERERALREADEDAPFPGWESLREEAAEPEPRVFLIVRDAAGNPVRRIEGPAAEGLHRVAWDLRTPPPDPVELTSGGGFRPPWVSDPQGALVAPGTYSVELAMVTADGPRQLAPVQELEVVPVATAPEGTDFDAAVAFQQRAAELMRRVSGAGVAIGEARERLSHMRAALVETPGASPELFTRIEAVETELEQLERRLWGDPVRARLSEPDAPSIAGRAGRVFGNVIETRRPATQTQRDSLAIAESDFEGFRTDLAEVMETELAQLERDLEAAGAPWTPGRSIGSGPGR